MSRFSGVEGCPPVEIFALGKAYKEDPHPQKVDLGIGAYRNNEGKPWILPVVRKAELEIASDETLNHEYLGQLGLDEFSRNATALLLGPDSPAIKEERAFGVQTLSGTGALRVGTDFLKLRANFNTIYVSNPTWGNHNLLSKMSGFTNDNIRSYRYWDKQNRKLDFDGMVEDLKSAPEDSVFLLHCCAHNPTGMDPTQEQWETIANIMQERKLFPFFDCAYQGFASGDLEKDSSIVRYFVSRGFELLCAQSFAKNFGLYNERVGNLTFVLKDKTPIVNVKAQLTILVRGNYSNPPAHGARVVAKVLSNPQLTEEWKDNIRTMANRIKDMRQQLKVKLDELGTPGTWDHITTQIGMFSYTGLNPSQVEYLVKQYHIYLPKDGRISLCGLNTNNVEYVAKAIDDAVRKFP